MKRLLIVEVRLKPGHSDPEGETTAYLLNELGYNVERVHVGKVYRIVLESESKDEAKEKAHEISKKLLANPTKDIFTIRIEEKE